MEGESGDITASSSNRKCSAVTGSARKTKDNAADWHNLMLKWERLNDDGFRAATSIVNLRRSQSDRLLVDESSSSSSPSLSSAAAAAQQVAAAAELQDECVKLQEVVDKMVAVVTKMGRLMTSQRGIRDLEEFQFGPEGRKVPLFHSWTSKQLEDSCHFLFAAFSQELRLKQTILQEVAHAATPDLGLVYLSCWLHQPFIPPNSRLTLEALLLETGHRPL
ncbi:cyclin-dependent kinase 2-interacting protein [Stegastes partitus]|uniref:Cyclin-dependent kinase 2-interacting protein n=1 Tax=Stegastes partitus TaxID=144197 RepID=A0A3B4ZPE9_9TELE|nr:PREDICTED: cyclin-dependent kinase 2-interacting protein [Stegastes partitus]